MITTQARAVLPALRVNSSGVYDLQALVDFEPSEPKSAVIFHDGLRASGNASAAKSSDGCRRAHRPVACGRPAMTCRSLPPGDQNGMKALTKKRASQPMALASATSPSPE